MFHPLVFTDHFGNVVDPFPILFNLLKILFLSLVFAISFKSSLGVNLIHVRLPGFKGEIPSFKFSSLSSPLHVLLSCFGYVFFMCAADTTEFRIRSPRCRNPPQVYFVMIFHPPPEPTGPSITDLNQQVLPP